MGVSVSFRARQLGFAWGMVVPEENAASVDRAQVQASEGAEGDPFCRHRGIQIQGGFANVFVFTNCFLEAYTRYTVLMYVSGIGGHDDGTLAGVADIARPTSNTFSSFPTIVGVPNGDGLIVQFRTRYPGIVWLVLTTGASKMTLDDLKAGIGALGDSTCMRSQLYVEVEMVSVDLTGCSLESGPVYALNVYTEGLVTRSDGDGTFAGTLRFQVVPTNSFRAYPVIVGRVTGIGFTFSLSARFVGRVWAILTNTATQQASDEVTFRSVKKAEGAHGASACTLSDLDLIGQGELQDFTLSDCDLTAGTVYHLYVYIEDMHNKNDGSLSLPIEVRVSAAMYFADSSRVVGDPEHLEFTVFPDGFQIALDASEKGSAWGAVVEDFEEAEAVSVTSFLNAYYPTNNLPCSPYEVPVETSDLLQNTSTLTFEACGLNYSFTYWVLIYIEPPGRTKSGVLSAPIPLHVPASNLFTIAPYVTF
jgi:hypothetical protein